MNCHLYQILYLFIFVARCPNNPNTIIFFQSDTHLLMLFFSPWKICVFMTRQVDLLYMKHNTSFQSQVMLAATQNSNFPRGPEQFIGWFMKFSVDFHKLKNRFKITNLTCSFTYLRWKTLFTRIKIQGGSKKPNSIVNLRRNLTFGLKVSRFVLYLFRFCICSCSAYMCSYIIYPA